ncbi:MAG: 50S ribosomal protein L9 [Verrucomicrobiae bacterium]|nr:50S ribosomal protein L9 [Verrucomicrobiae bacterium]
MSKTEVILIQNVVGLGAETDHVKVAPGYARNFLYPRGLAIPLTAANKRRLEVLKQRRGEREANELNAMSELGRSMSKLILHLKVKTGEDGRMFGGVTSGLIVDELKNQFDAVVDKKKIHIEHPIRTLGDHEVELRLHPEVVVTMKVLVESSTPLPPKQEEDPAKAGKDKEAAAKGERPARGARGPDKFRK